MNRESEELERRGRDLIPIETTVLVCLNCGDEIARTSTFERRGQPERGPWVDPYAAGGVAMFKANHKVFCKAKGRFGRRLPPRTTEIVVRNVP